MIWRIEVEDRPNIFDAVGASIKKDIQDLGISKISEVKFIQVYIIKGNLSRVQAHKISSELLSDPITQKFHILTAYQILKHHGFKVVEIAYNPGVMDPVEDSVLKGIRDMGINGVERVHTAKKYLLKGSLSAAQFKIVGEKVLFNKLIQHIVSQKDKFYDAQIPEYKFSLTKIDLLGADDSRLLEISQKGQLFLNLEEMQIIKSYFKDIRRNPTDCELETIAQTWSEHCNHKTFRCQINYSEREDGKTKNSKVINGLLKSTIMKVTRELKKPWCVSVFHDNSGIIRFDDQHNVCFKVETHNHPSALEPFGGANTGVGGVIRDPLGTGLGAKPILNTDVFCFGQPDYSFSKLPKGTLHPKRVMKGVVSGVRDYGNKMGIPTVNGAIIFDENYVGNPLVYCGNVGLMPKNKSFKKTRKGDCIVVVGGRTGRDGIHGATFSSGELTHESEQVSGGAVQIGNPITEKKVVDVLLKARDKNLFNAVTDCGAGGLSSAVGEMGAELGARVDLEKVPLKYKGLSYTEIWISEAQERMVLAVAKTKLKKLIEEFKKENVEATKIGEFTSTKRLELFYYQNKVCDLKMDFLHEGLSQLKKEAVWHKPSLKEPVLKAKEDLTKDLQDALSSLNIASKEWVIRQYDHEVQGASVIKPLVGVDNDGPSDAAVARPILSSKQGLIVSCGINPRYGMIDPFWMAAACIDEALRQIIAVGGSLEQTAILDNFCWGNPDKPDRLGGLVRTAQGCYEAARAFGVPFISGKDSLYNEFKVKGKSIAIPGTILISAISVMRDVTRAISMDFKANGNLIYLVGETYNELGGSAYYLNKKHLGANVPKVNFSLAPVIMKTLSQASQKGLVRSAHDCSDGGLAVALAEMCFAGGLGAEVFLAEMPNPKEIIQNNLLLFSESNSRFLVEVEAKHKQDFESAMKKVPFGLVGCVCDEEVLNVYGLDGKACISARINDLKESWQRPLRW